MMSLLALFYGCTDDNAAGCYDDDVVNDVVVADFALGVTVPQQDITRMSKTVTQSNGAFRGLSDAIVVPFAVKRKVEIDDDPKSFIIRGIEQSAADRLYYYPHCSFAKGSASVLCYAKASKADGAGKAENGSLLFSADERMRPSSIQISPDPIYTKPASVIPEQAQVIADYLTCIANARTAKTSWRSEKEETFKGAFQNFISLGTGLLPGSYPCVKGHVQSIIDYLDKFDSFNDDLKALREAIRDSIMNKEPAHIDKHYPASIGLPDGAAVLRWMGDAFMPQTQRTSVADINSIDHFSYPAELYYYANSRLITHNDTIKYEDYQSAGVWSMVLNMFKRDPSVSVNSNTRAVAVVDPLQYGVACLKVILKPVPSSLPDAHQNLLGVKHDGKPSFPLTGIVVSGQRAVNYAFMPETTSDAEDYFIYDNQVQGVAMDAVQSQAPTYTLLLQSPVSMKVNLLLEFRNDSGQNFYGRNGDVIYQGSKFYLLGVINPMDKDQNGDSRPQAFTQDEYTTIHATVKTLANAYNVMPNLMNPRLEIGVELTPKWTLSTPINVEFY